jgi:hypothetical protein
MKIRTYSELIKLPTFEDRYKYLRLRGVVGEETFGFDRFMNQDFYRSREWKDIRDFIIVRDNGCDLAMEGYDIHGKIIIHHMNPITIKDIQENSAFLMEPEYLISTTLSTHNAIHYGDESLLVKEPVIRSKNDTCPWKQKF